MNPNDPIFPLVTRALHLVREFVKSDQVMPAVEDLETAMTVLFSEAYALGANSINNESKFVVRWQGYDVFAGNEQECQDYIDSLPVGSDPANYFIVEA